MRRIILAAVCAMICALPAAAQPQDRSGPGGRGAAPAARGPQGPAGRSSIPQRNPGRGATGQGPVFGGRGFAGRTPYLPQPNRWRGDIGRFDHNRWDGGRWIHGTHGGRFAWWWVVGPDWYFYPAPIYPYPDTFTPPGMTPGWWYWCDIAQDYYPYVTYCASRWRAVSPR